MKFRQFDLRIHDIQKITTLIIETAPWLFYLIFGKKKAHRRIQRLVQIGNNFFGKEHIYLAINNDDIYGLSLFYRGSDIDFWNEFKQILKALDLTGFLRLIFLNKIFLRNLLTQNIGKSDLYFSNLVAESNHRGKGVGTFLFEKVIERAKQLNCRTIILDVETKNTIGINLYKRYGFAITKHRSSKLFKVETYQMIKQLR